MTQPKKKATKKAATPKPEAPAAPAPESQAATGLFIPDTVRETLEATKVHVDKSKEGKRVLTPFIPANPAEMQACIDEGKPFEGLALWESVYVQPLTNGGMLVNIGTTLEFLGTKAQCEASPIEAIAIRGGAGGGVNGPAMEAVFGNPEAIRILTEAGVPLEGELGLKEQFANTNPVRKLRDEHREWRQDLANQQGRGRRGRGRQPDYVRPTGPSSFAGPAGDRVAGDFAFEQPEQPSE